MATVNKPFRSFHTNMYATPEAPTKGYNSVRTGEIRFKSVLQQGDEHHP
jgi:hypothetical protein